MAKPDVGMKETAVSWLNPRNTHLTLSGIGHQMRSENFLGDSHRASRYSLLLCACSQWDGHTALEPCDIELKESAILNDLAGNVVFILSEFCERDLLTSHDPVNNPQIS
jgi:hypothetical protein